MVKRRTLLDAFMDLAVRFVDAVDAEKLLTDRREKKALQVKVIETTAEEVTSASEPDSDTTNEP